MSKTEGMAHTPLSICENVSSTILRPPFPQSNAQTLSVGLCSLKRPRWFRSENHQLSARATQWRKCPSLVPLGQSTLDKKLKAGLLRSPHQVNQSTSLLPPTLCQAPGALRDRPFSSRSFLKARNEQQVVKVTMNRIPCNGSRTGT